MDESVVEVEGRIGVRDAKDELPFSQSMFRSKFAQDYEVRGANLGLGWSAWPSAKVGSWLWSVWTGLDIA